MAVELNGSNGSSGAGRAAGRGPGAGCAARRGRARAARRHALPRPPRARRPNVHPRLHPAASAPGPRAPLPPGLSGRRRQKTIQSVNRCVFSIREGEPRGLPASALDALEAAHAPPPPPPRAPSSPGGSSDAGAPAGEWGRAAVRALGARVLAALLAAAEADAADDVREAALAAVLAPGAVQHPAVCARLDALGDHPVSARAPAPGRQPPAEERLEASQGSQGVDALGAIAARIVALQGSRPLRLLRPGLSVTSLRPPARARADARRGAGGQLPWVRVRVLLAAAGDRLGRNGKGLAARMAAAARDPDPSVRCAPRPERACPCVSDTLRPCPTHTRNRHTHRTR